MIVTISEDWWPLLIPNMASGVLPLGPRLWIRCGNIKLLVISSWLLEALFKVKDWYSIFKDLVSVDPHYGLARGGFWFKGAAILKYTYFNLIKSLTLQLSCKSWQIDSTFGTDKCLWKLQSNNLIIIWDRLVFVLNKKNCRDFCGGYYFRERSVSLSSGNSSDMSDIRPFSS